MPINHAAYLPAKGAKLEVKEAPYRSPPAGYLTVKVHAAAVNPCDYFQQDTGLFIASYPYILGCDLAGTVVEVGPEVTSFSVGDRIASLCAGQIVKDSNGTSVIYADKGEGGFQTYAVVSADTTSHLPGNISFEDGCVFPLTIMTAGCTVYLPAFLGLHLPPIGLKPVDQESYVLIWGAASSVGSNAVQLAVNSGYHVLAIASAKNFRYCEELGAEKAFDYHSAQIVDDIVAYLKGKKVAGTMSAVPATSSIESLVQIAQRTEGSKKIGTVVPGAEKLAREGIEITVTMGDMAKADVMGFIYRDFVPKALETGAFKARPKPLVVGQGLESAQKGLDVVKAGMSASKAVIGIVE